MLKDGLFTRFPRPSFAVALHVTPELPAGQVGVTPGPGLRLRRLGRRDDPREGRATARCRTGRSTRSSSPRGPSSRSRRSSRARRTRSSRPSSASARSRPGAKHNVIPPEARLKITVRAYREEVRQKLLEGIRRVAAGESMAAGAPVPPDVTSRRVDARRRERRAADRAPPRGLLRGARRVRTSSTSRPRASARTSPLRPRGRPRVDVLARRGEPRRPRRGEGRPGRALPPLHSAEFCSRLRPVDPRGGDGARRRGAGAPAGALSVRLARGEPGEERPAVPRDEAVPVALDRRDEVRVLLGREGDRRGADEALGERLAGGAGARGGSGGRARSKEREAADGPLPAARTLSEAGSVDIRPRSGRRDRPRRAAAGADARSRRRPRRARSSRRRRRRAIPRREAAGGHSRGPGASPAGSGTKAERGGSVRGRPSAARDDAELAVELAGAPASSQPGRGVAGARRGSPPHPSERRDGGPRQTGARRSRTSSVIRTARRLRENRGVGASMPAQEGRSRRVERAGRPRCPGPRGARRRRASTATPCAREEPEVSVVEEEPVRRRAAAGPCAPARRARDGAAHGPPNEAPSRGGARRRRETSSGRRMAGGRDEAAVGDGLAVIARGEPAPLRAVARRRDCTAS